MANDNLETGFRLGKYEIVSHIATGGMGTVYQARDTELGRVVALKVLPPRLAENPRVLGRFRREARHAAQLNHPNIVTLYECGYDAGADLNFLAMEFIDGIDLEDHIRRRGKLPPREARHILVRVTRALEHAHERGIVHRDIKPSNILLAKNGDKVVVKLTDLGLARTVDDADFKVTRDGSTVGTIDYLAPEQARDSRSADIRSDIYSLGCTAYHMLAGRAPFARGGLGERIYQHLQTDAEDVRLHNPEVSEAFWNIIAKMLGKQPADRYQTPAELHADLKGVSPDATKSQTAESHFELTGGLFGDHTPRPTPLESSATLSGLTEAPAPLPAEKSASDSDLVRAKAFHERAVKTLVGGGSNDYARQLLESCLSLAPFAVGYRKTLRELNRKASAATFTRWFGPLSGIAVRSKLHHAEANGQWRKVLDRGEELLGHLPSDTEAHLAMTKAAIELAQPALANWLVEQALETVRDKAAFFRGLGAIFESRGEWTPAAKAWIKVREFDPLDRDANHKINALTAQQHLAGGHYGS